VAHAGSQTPADTTTLFDNTGVAPLANDTFSTRWRSGQPLGLPAAAPGAPRAACVGFNGSWAYWDGVAAPRKSPLALLFRLPAGLGPGCLASVVLGVAPEGGAAPLLSLRPVRPSRAGLVPRQCHPHWGLRHRPAAGGRRRQPRGGPHTGRV
jgi:hypothetical protein